MVLYAVDNNEVNNKDYKNLIVQLNKSNHPIKYSYNKYDIFFLSEPGVYLSMFGTYIYI